MNALPPHLSTPNSANGLIHSPFTSHHSLDRDPTMTLQKSVACLAGYGSGGLGRHLAEIVEETNQAQRLQCYYTPYPQANDRQGRSVLIPPLANWLTTTLLRYSPGWQNHLFNELFDRAVAKVLQPTEEFEGFGGQTLYSFRRARQLGTRVLAMQAANSHVANIKQQHQKAIQEFNFEASWLNTAQYQKTIKEYEIADVIYYASEYTRKSFLNAGIAEHKLRKRYFKPHPRFVPADRSQQDGRFRIVYSGSLTVMKGIPILIEAFSRIPDRDAELILVGGWATKGMRHYLESWLAKDTRIKIRPGDPLPHLQQASVYVHPSYEDGFAYAPMEALACKVPAIVTEDTGMKEHIQPGVNGDVIPTGDWRSLVDCLEHYRTRSCVTEVL